MTMVGMKDLILVTPMLILLVTSIIPITVKVLSDNREQSLTGTMAPAFLGLVLAAVLTLILNTGETQTIFGGTVKIDGMYSWMAALVMGLAAFSLLLMRESEATPFAQFSEYTFLLIGSVIGMLVLLAASDLITVFIGLEIMSLALYILIAVSNEQKLSKEAAFKYFILGSFASAVFLYGTAFIFGSLGSTSLDQIALSAPELINSDRLFVFGVILVTLAFCFKVSIFPFHAWTPDVYQGASTPMTAYMSTAVKAVSIIAFFRFMSTQAIYGSQIILDCLQWLAVGTMFVGNVAALLQNNMKRMLAFSSISHSGYMMMAIIVAGVSSDHMETASQALVFYLFSYCIMTMGALAVVNYFERAEDSMINVDDLAGVSQRHPWVAIALAVFMLSLAGIPPTLGFFAKLSLFSATIAEGLYWLAIWGVINSVISVYYYLRPIVVMYMKPFDNVQTSKRSTATQFTMYFMALLILALGLYSNPLYNIALSAAIQ